MATIKKLSSTEDLRQAIDEQIRAREADQRAVLIVSAGTCGQARGSMEVIEALEKEIEEKNLGDRVRVKTTGCHGFCEAEPNIIIQPHDYFYQHVQPENAGAIVGETVLNHNVLENLLYKDPNNGNTARTEAEIGFYSKQERIVLGDNALIDPTELSEYLSIRGYSSLAKMLDKMQPQDVIEEVKSSGIRGRGGAGFPTGRKWEFARKAAGDLKYIICNADEGDPGAYMDRSLMEGNPHRVLEGMIIGGYAIGAREGYIYIREEYPLALHHITRAIQQAGEAGLLGDDILGSGFSFKVKIVKGAGAFVCGEETALINSIQGKVGEPRQRPPFPAVRGLWKKPTNINNVETWANIPIIIEKGADWYSAIGTEGSKGTKIFSLVGKINNTGLVEVPMGITLREVIFDIGGGIPGGKPFKAVQTGGPSGGCIPAEKLDLPIDYESLAKVGSIMGSGGMIVMDEGTCMVDIAKYFLNFLRDESCGKCVSCREGTQRMWEIVTAITEGRGKESDIALLTELAQAVKDASMCGLGQTAANPVFSTLRYFLEEYEQHIKYKRCPAMVCRELVSAPCQYICPIDQEASVYIALIAHHKFEEAYHVIMKDNPFASVCGRVCDHQCESVCRAREFGEPIGIRSLKRFVMDWAAANEIEPPRIDKAEKRGIKTAVVGAGPAGLTAAYNLALKGYDVTVFEASPVAGGWPALGIPDHRLPKASLKVDIDNILKMGIELKTETAMGLDFTLEDLFERGFKAAFIAIGAHKSMKLGVPGEDAEGVIEGTRLLKDMNLGRKVALGRRVGIVGGGNVAIDAARSALRNPDTESVTIIYRRTRKEMPAYEEEIEAALEEGIDIQFLVTPTKVLTEEDRVTEIECIRMRLGEMDDSGRRRPVPIEGSEFRIAIDTLIPAIGERPHTSYLGNGNGMKLTRWDTIVADEETLQTGRPEVFTGGDVFTGPNTVVKAIAAGKQAADSMDKYLRGESLAKTYAMSRPSRYIEAVELTEEEIESAKRPAMPHLPIDQRSKNFREVELGFSEDMAVMEARRCLRCELETEDAKNALEKKQ